MLAGPLEIEFAAQFLLLVAGRLEVLYQVGKIGIPLLQLRNLSLQGTNFPLDIITVFQFLGEEITECSQGDEKQKQK